MDENFKNGQLRSVDVDKQGMIIYRIYFSLLALYHDKDIVKS